MGFCRYVIMLAVDFAAIRFHAYCILWSQKQSHQKFKKSDSSWSRPKLAHWTKQRGCKLKHLAVLRYVLMAHYPQACLKSDKNPPLKSWAFKINATTTKDIF